MDEETQRLLDVMQRVEQMAQAPPTTISELLRTDADDSDPWAPLQARIAAMDLELQTGAHRRGLVSDLADAMQRILEQPD
jgi:hypothetical protein